MFNTYQNIPISLNNNFMFANQANISLNTSLNPYYFTNQRHSFGYNAINSINGSLRLNYYLTGKDFIKEYIDNEKTPISGNIGGLYFESGYLRTYSINCIPNSAVQTNIEIIFFEELKGNFCSYYDLSSPTELLGFSDVEIINLNTGTLGILDNISNITYNFDSQIIPLYNVASYLPYDINFKEKTISMEIETDNIDGNLPIYGKQAGIKVNFTHPKISNINENITCSGILHSRNFNVDSSNISKTTLSIKQNYIDAPPLITGFSSLSGQLSGYIYIYGSNLINTTYIKFYSLDLNGGESKSFKINSTNELYAQIPIDAFTGPITVENYYGKFATGIFQVIRPSTIIF